MPLGTHGSWLEQEVVCRVGRFVSRWLLIVPVLFILMIGHSASWAWSFQGALRIYEPKDGAVIGWGREAPMLVIRAAIENGGQPVADKNLFLTAVIQSEGQLVDRVPLYDDGSHGDARARDGIYTTTYRPPEPKAYTVKVRAVRIRPQGSQESPQERWSPQSSFYVEPIPYPHLVSPEPGSRVGRSLQLRARLLLGDQPFTEDDPSLKCQVVWTDEQGVQRRVEPSQVRRQRSEIRCPVEFQRLGEHRVQVIVQVNRRGQTVSAESVPVVLEVANPPITWLVFSAFLFAVIFFLPPKPPILLYNPTLEVQENPRAYKTFTIDASPEGAVHYTIGSSGCDFVVEGVQDRLCTVIVEPGSPTLVVVAESNKKIRRGFDVLKRAQVNQGETFSIDNIQFRYTDARITSRPFPRWYPTRLKIATGILVLVSLAVGLWQYMTFFQE